MSTTTSRGPASPGALLRIESVSKAYVRGVDVLREVFLEAGPGVHGLLGPNGAGKSTLLAILSGSLLPDAGGVTLGTGLSASRNPRKWKLAAGVLPQHFDFPPHLTGRELMAMAVALLGRSVRAARGRASWLLERVNLLDAADRPAAGYSRGMKQRLGLALALAHEPRLLLLDEPTSGLDPLERVLFRELLLEVAAGGTICLLSTHVVGDVERCCTALAVLDRGEIRYRGAPGGLLERARGKVWQLECPPGEVDHWVAGRRVVAVENRGERALLRLVSDKPPAPDALPVSATLEDAYVHLLEGGIMASAEG